MSKKAIILMSTNVIVIFCRYYHALFEIALRDHEYTESFSATLLEARKTCKDQISSRHLMQAELDLKRTQSKSCTRSASVSRVENLAINP